MIESLFIYILGLAIIYVAAIFSQNSFKAGKIISIICLLFVGSISVFRGNVGTDTAAYEKIVGSMREGISGGLEPGFVALTNGLIHIGLSDMAAVRFFSALYVVTLIVYVIRADKRELAISIIYYVPSFFYTYSMNALRIGIAVNILLLSFQKFNNSSKYVKLLFGSLSILFHYSAIIPYIYLVWSRFSTKLIKALPWLLLALLCLFPLIFLLENYISQKINLYRSMESPSALSGIVYVFSVSIIAISICFSDLKREKLSTAITGVSLIIFAFIISRFTYAGLRIMELVATIYPFVVSVKFDEQKRQFNAVFIIALFVAGFANAIFVFRRFVVDPGTGSSPWLPYEWLF